MVVGSADRLHQRNQRALGRRFDLILLGAVWMHLAPSGREPAFRIHSELLGPSSLLVITLRRGGDAAENAARGLHDTSAEELIGHANSRVIALACCGPWCTSPKRRPGLSSNARTSTRISRSGPAACTD